MATTKAEEIGDARGAAPAGLDVVAEFQGAGDWAPSADLLVRMALDEAEDAAGPSASRRRRTEKPAAASSIPAGCPIAVSRPGREDDEALGIALIDPERLALELRSADTFAGDPDEAPASTSREDEERRTFLRRHADRPGGLFRPHLVADADTIARLRVIKAEAPNAGRVIEVVERMALLSWHARSPLRVPPILVLGPPGTGKSRIARRIAEALGTESTTIDGGTVTDRGPFVGHDLGYRGSSPGKVARALLDGGTAGPLILLDEVDKVSSYSSGVRPLDALLALLEPTTAESFVDTYIGLPMHAEGVSWVMTANQIAGLPEPFLDRVVVVEMPRLGRAETRAALQRMLAELLASHGLPAAALGDAALDRLQTAGLRQARRTLALALGPALAAGRPAPDAADVAGTASLLDAPAPRRRAPRKPVPPPPRPPVGFMRFPAADTPAPVIPPPRRRGR